MWYEINVSKWTRQADGKERYVHLFATHERSLTTRDKAKDLYHLFEEKFPEEEGYRIDVVRCEKTNNTVIF